MAEKTSLEKSHSKWSNFKLTLLCILTSIFVSVFWGTLALRNQLGNALFAVLLIISGVLTLGCLALLNMFKR